MKVLASHIFLDAQNPAFDKQELNTFLLGHAQQRKLLVSSACIIGSVRTNTAPRISGRGVRRKCCFCYHCLQGPDAEQVEQSTVLCEDIGLGEPVGEEG